MLADGFGWVTEDHLREVVKLFEEWKEKRDGSDD